MAFHFGEIGYWSEIKLDIVRRYAIEYSKIMAKHTEIRKHVYVDAFAGAGWSISRRTGSLVRGSPLNALSVTSPFKEFHFIELDGRKVAELRRQVGDRTDVFIHEDDANKVLLEEVFPRCQFTDYHRALCLLDPYGLDVDWKVVETAGHMQSIEIFYNFMIMDANMNVLWGDPDKADPAQVARMDRAWGDHSWRQAAYRPQRTLFGDSWDMKTGNEAVAEAFRKRLHEVAGFKFVPKPIPMRNKKGAIIYYLFFATHNETGHTIVRHIFEHPSLQGGNAVNGS